jgi:hypothetical protein
MCKNTCNKCHQCTDICSCRAKLEPCATTNCKEKISTDCVWYKFGNQSSMSNLMCFLGVPNNTNLTAILEKLDSKLCGLYNLKPDNCARQLLGLPVTTDIVYVIGKLLDYICTVQDVKVKVSATDLSGGYLIDKIDVGDCLIKTITQDLAGNQKLKISIDYVCLKTKIPTCIEVNCSECSQNTCVVPVFGTPTVVCQGNNSIVNVNVTSPAFSLIQFSSDEGITWVNGNPNSYTFTFASTGALQKIKARVAGCTVYADGYVQLCTVAPSPTAPSPSPVAPSPASPVAPTTPTAPSPVAPTTPTAPSPVSPSPSPVAPTAPSPVAPSPVAPSPVAPTAPSPVAPTPVAPSPVAPPTCNCKRYLIQNDSGNNIDFSYTDCGTGATQNVTLINNTSTQGCSSSDTNFIDNNSGNSITSIIGVSVTDTGAPCCP